MKLWLWNLIAEVLGFGSGVLLLLPALSLNRLLRDVDETMQSFAAAKTAFGRKLGQEAEPALRQARVPRWSARDQAMLQTGAMLLAASFLIKIFVVLATPAG